MGTIISICFAAILTENFVLSKFMGICAFLGVSKKTDTSIGMGMAVTFVMTISTLVTWLINRYILVPFDFVYLRTIVFTLVIACLVQLIEMFLRKCVPSLYKALGIYLPLITTNCAVLGVTILMADSDYTNILYPVIYAFAAGLGFTLAIVLFSGIREKLKFCDIPKPFRGFPIALIAAALLAMAFSGFQGLNLPF